MVQLVVFVILLFTLFHSGVSLSEHRWCYPESCYQLLNVSSTATRSEIRRAYHVMSLKYHPDKVPLEQREQSSKVFIEIANAWEILSNEEVRKEYDGWLAAGAKWDNDKDIIFASAYGEPRELEANWITSLGVIIAIGIPLLVPLCCDGRRGKKSRWQKFVSSVETLKDRWFPETIEEDNSSEHREVKARVVRTPKQPTLEPAIANIQAVAPQLDARPENNNSNDKTSNIRVDEWTKEEDHLLAQAVVKYPGGTLQRWEKVAGFVGSRSAEQVVTRAKQLKSKPMQTNAKNEISSSSSSSIATSAAVATSPTIASNTGPTVALSSTISSTSSTKDSGRPWSTAEQQALEAALRQFPAADPERWDKIAIAVPGRSKKDCVNRYKELSLLIKAKKQQLA